ncbi:MAG: four helix bundle suffix domain-containing protein [Parcubacteria group bacterium]
MANWANQTDRTNRTDDANLLFKHGGYRNLKSYQMSTLVYDLTVEFCKKFIDFKSRTNDQMVQAARSGRQNIAEGSQAAATSKKTELKLTSVARASLEELLIDYEDFLRQRGLKMWAKDSMEAKNIRNLAYASDKSYQSYSSYLRDGELAANVLICLIHQTNYLLDRQLKTLSDEFLQQGGFTERLYNQRKNLRGNNYN